ncbi:MAG TPA: dihydrolipoamide acetyltransferase family protein [Thermomicrobiales bacterium]|nr:dihydrolipoamide acetyltransferase family protein [Thermomicrobiales bacterium]
MAEVIMPKMGDAMEEGTLLKWLKAVGDEVSEGDALAEIETDKVTLELEAQEDGFLTNTLVDEGAVVPIGEPVATIGAQDEIGKGAPAKKAPAAAETAVEEVEKAAEANAPTEQPMAAPSAAEKAEAQVVDRKPGERVRASPLVKRLAEEHGIDLSQVAGTGPGGRIINADIQPYVSGEKQAPQPTAAAQPAVAPTTTPSTGTPKGEKVDMPKIKRTTGKRMTESKLGIPHYYVTASIDMGASLDFRKQINASLEETGIRVSVNDLIVKAAALALRDHPNVNRTFVDGELYQQDAIDVNIAIAMDGGLIAPFVPAADEKSLGSIAKMTKDLGKRAREGGLTPEEYQGGTFTISNLGMFDVDEFIAVINPPQVAILAIGSVVETPVVKNGEIAVGHLMKVTLSADHRALDGAEVATFLQSVRKYLENPMLLAIG